MKKILAIIAGILFGLLPITVMAATITIYNVPAYGIMNFTITQINDHQLDFDWDYGSPAVAIMIRAKYGAYPNDIPADNITPSDGYLIYAGSGIHASDYTVNLDSTSTTPLYIRAWGQRLDGTWILNDVKSNNILEGLGMVLIAIIILCAVSTYFSLRSSNILLALGAAITWIILFAYTRSNPIAGMTTGSFPDQLVIYLCWIFAVVLLITAVTRGRRERRYAGTNGVRAEWGETREIKQSSRVASRPSIMAMNGVEYREYMRNRVRPSRRAR